jgi:hypothetical protein
MPWFRRFLLRWCLLGCDLLRLAFCVFLLFCGRHVYLRNYTDRVVKQTSSLRCCGRLETKSVNDSQQHNHFVRSKVDNKNCGETSYVHAPD